MNFFLQKALLASLALLLGACAGVARRGTPRVYSQAFDTETNACLRFPGNCPGAQQLAAQQKLHEIRPKGFSLNQRYKENKATGKWEPLSDQQTQALLQAGGAGLLGTIVPDIVIHTGNVAEVLDVFDLKFPCPGTNRARWDEYPPGHPNAPSNQGQVYEKAFGVDQARVAPRWDIRRLNEP
jgi:hypothetical protein